MKTLNDYKALLETRLDISGTLTIEGNEIKPNAAKLTKATIKSMHLEDLFQFHQGKLIFTNRMLHFVSDITDRQLFAAHYALTLRN